LYCCGGFRESWNKACLKMAGLTDYDVHFVRDSLKKLKSSRGEEFNQIIHELNRKIQLFFDFSACPLFVLQELANVLGNCLDERAGQFNDRVQILDLLLLIRILSRDKEFSNYIGETKLMAYVFHFSDLQDKQLLSVDNGPWDLEVRLEAKKVLCNVFGYHKLVESFSSLNFQCQNAFYDLRILFVLTCLSTVNSVPLLDEENILQKLYLFLLELKNSNDEPLSVTVVDLAIETLKVLFTVISSGLTMQTASMNDTSLFFNNLVLLCRQYLLSTCECVPKYQNLISQVINVLTLCIPETYPLLIPACDHDLTGNGKTYRDYDVSALNVILQLLSDQCDESDTSVIQPTLALLACIARSNPVYKKYLRSEILPPLKDVHTRPENDVSIRGKLVRLMTSVTNVSMWAANFLYVLCNENVHRLVKYTGFGNAAGLLVSLGVLTSSQLKNSKTNDSNCSSSTDSETEEYKQAKDLINPVLGCVEPPKPNPMEGMTEEQKEHEIVQLVNQIDSLMKQGLVMPARVCEDGKVHPIEHVMQLQEGLPKTPSSSSDIQLLLLIQENPPKKKIRFYFCNTTLATLALCSVIRLNKCDAKLNLRQLKSKYTVLFKGNSVRIASTVNGRHSTTSSERDNNSRYCDNFARDLQTIECNKASKVKIQKIKQQPFIHVVNDEKASLSVDSKRMQSFQG
ncbi:Synembryn-A, partial [Trichinella papuae]